MSKYPFGESLNFSNFYTDPNVWFCCAIAVFTAVLLMRTYKKSRKINEKQPEIFPASQNQTAYYGYSLPPVPSEKLRQTVEQWEIDIHNLMRQCKAELDTKMVALQIITAEAARQVEKLESLLAQTGGNGGDGGPSPSPLGPLNLKKFTHFSGFSDLTENPSRNEGKSSEENGGNTEETQNSETISPEEMKVPDPFTEIGFADALEELKQMSHRRSRMNPNAETVPQLPVSEEEPSDEPFSSGESGVSESLKRGEQLGRATILRGLFPEFDEIHRVRQKKRTDITFSPQTVSAHMQPPRLEALLSQTPPEKPSESPTLMMVHPPSVDIPKTPSPQAVSIFAEESVLMTEDAPIHVHRDKSHQVRFLAGKGISSRDIAAFIGMSVGEVEMILSLQRHGNRHSLRVKAD
ncbi:MAG: hypothetical protein LBQ54_00190 [Planctomycetaceae bacterium]|nr:hypothetical protein [Planctomycetaceae bacterium]